MEYLNNPISSIPVDFPGFVNQRKAIESRRMDANNVPNYAFALDWELRKKLDAIPGFYTLAKKISATSAARQYQQLNMTSLKVGPNQFRDVYEIIRYCANTLGIAVPNVFIVDDSSMNAIAIATDDVEPVIMLYSGLYERFTEGELMATLGHECGHLQNKHGSYNVLSSLLLNVGMNGLAQYTPANMMYLLSDATQMALNAWSRAAEVTCDRAGMICCNNLEDAYSGEAKFMYGGAFGKHEVNYKEVLKQLEQQRKSIVRYEEILNLNRQHPTSARRIAAEMEFAECEVLYQWRPDLKKPGMVLRSKEATDERCREIISVSRKG